MLSLGTSIAQLTFLGLTDASSNQMGCGQIMCTVLLDRPGMHIHQFQADSTVLLTGSHDHALQSVPGVSISKSGGLVIAGGCQSISLFPDLTLSLGNGSFTWTPQEYIVQARCTNPRTLKLTPGSDLCFCGRRLKLTKQVGLRQDLSHHTLHRWRMEFVRWVSR